MLNKILIIGNGFVGKNLFNYFNKNSDNVIITNKSILNVEKEEEIKNYFYNKTFDLIIYAAGIKDIKHCEIDKEKAYNVNSYSIKNIQTYANFKKIVYISTDYVFDGSKGNYTEIDLPNPSTVYGKSKLLGEQFTLDKNKKGIVVRTSGIYGDGCKWIDWINNEVYLNNKIKCFEDVINTPTYVLDLAKMIEQIVIEDYFGIINVCGSTAVNRFELFKKFLEINNFGTNNLIISKNDGMFPSNLSLNNDKFYKMFKYKPLSLEEGLKHLKELNNENKFNTTICNVFRND